MKKPLIFAHRGASSRYPENTLEAIKEALRLNVDGIEIDVQFSRDRQIMVIHDHTLARTTNGTGRVQDFTAAELQRLDAGSWLSPSFSGCTIPRLEEVLQTIVPTNTKLLIELKNFFVPQPELEMKVLDLITLYDLTDRVIISSFNFDSLLRIKTLLPRVTTGLLYFGPLQRPWEMARTYRADQIHAPVQALGESFIRECHDHDFSVYGWTLNSSDSIQKAIDYNIDGTISDVPERAIKLRR